MSWFGKISKTFIPVFKTMRLVETMTGHIKATGSKAEVFHGTAKHTSGGLKKGDLMKHHGRIISRKKHAAGKKAIKHLRALGYIAKKGTFKLMRKSMAKASKKSKRHTRKHGGANGLVSGFYASEPAKH
jgi:hypothetical protein